MFFLICQLRKLILSLPYRSSSRSFPVPIPISLIVPIVIPITVLITVQITISITVPITVLITVPVLITFPLSTRIIFSFKQKKRRSLKDTRTKRNLSITGMVRLRKKFCKFLFIILYKN